MAKLTKTQATKALTEAGIIVHEITGSGRTYTVEVDATHYDRVRDILTDVGGYRTGYDTYVFDTAYAPSSDDYCHQERDHDTHLPVYTLGDIVS